MIFTTIDSNEIKAGAPNDQLGVSADISQLELNKVLLGQITTLKAEIDSLKSELNEARVSTSDITVNKSVYNEAKYSNVDFKVSKNSNDFAFEWDLDNMINSLPEETVVTRSRVIIDGGNIAIADSSKSKASISVLPEDMPLNVTVEVSTYDKKDGKVKYSNDYVITTEAGEQSQPLTAKPISSDITLQNQASINNYLLNEVGKLRKG
jgi:hypothetical protein